MNKKNDDGMSGEGERVKHMRDMRVRVGERVKIPYVCILMRTGGIGNRATIMASMPR